MLPLRGMSADAPSSQIGELLDGRYRLLERLAAGGMGEVFRGERVPIGRPVAIKFLHAVFADDRESRARFERETKVLSRLSHPNCVSVIDFGVAGRPYLVMDYAPGTTLRAMLDDAVLAPAQAIALTRQLLIGLHHAHGQGIVHRDVKPANLMVADDEGAGLHLRILDFGLARLRGGGASSVTQTAVALGTPGYMAPEQTLASEVDARTDVYATGIVLFEMLVGHRPFVADEISEVLAMHRDTPAPHLAEAAPDLVAPAGLDDVIQRALAKSPDDRFASALEMAQALEQVERGQYRPPAPPRRGWTGRGVLALAALVVVAAGAVAAWMATRPDGADRARGSAGAGVVTPAVTVGGDAGPAPTLAPRPVDAAATPVGAGGDADPAAGQPALAATFDGDAAPAPAELVAADASPGDPGGGDAAMSAAGAEAAGAEIEFAIEEVAEADPGASEPASGEDDPAAASEPLGAGAGSDSGSGSGAGSGTPADPAPSPALRAAQARDAQIAALRRTWRDQPRSGKVPYQLGNLYFAKKWWTVAIEHYQAAIKRVPAYRKNTTVIGNAIRALASPKARGKASYFLQKVVGAPARPYLKRAAKSDPSPAVRRAAGYLARRV